ncbi:DUF6040 family protein [Blautia argi]|nr:DUF6040 family protein [Blautia argi]
MIYVFLTIFYIFYFGETIKKVLSVNLLLLFVLSQGAYVGLRCYLKTQLNTKQHW